jgi:hypothetical protein
MHIPASTTAAVRDDSAIIGLYQIGQRLTAFLVESDGARRHPDNEVLAVTSVLLLAASGFTIAGNQTRLVFEIKQGGKPLIDFQDHVTAPAAIATGWTAERPVFFAQKCYRPVTAVASVDIYSGLVYKAHGRTERL